MFRGEGVKEGFIKHSTSERVDGRAIIVENSPLAKPYRLVNVRNQKKPGDYQPAFRIVNCTEAMG